MVLSRRQVLAGTAGALGVCALASCGDDTGQPRPTTDVVLDVSGIEPGQGRLYAAERVFVARQDDGTFAAYDPTCPHQQCAVTGVRDGRIFCPCHGSTFDTATGARVAGPAQSGLRQLRTTGDGTQLTVQPG